MPFLDSLDIANRACQILGVEKIESPAEDSRNNREMSTAYDRLLSVEQKANDWRFCIKRVAIRCVTPTTMLLAPAQWNQAQLYLPGAIVADANGDLWLSVTPENVGNTPGTSSAWDQYFGSMTVDIWTAALGYYAGELVYMQVGNPGSYVVFMSLQNNNEETPNVPDVWSSTVTYGMDDVIQDQFGVQWRSLIALNTGITPANGPLAWQVGTTYSATQQVTGSDGYIYTSAVNSNLGNNPVTDSGTNWTNSLVPTAWTNSPSIYPTSSLWVPVFASLKSMFIVSPVGASPASNQYFRNLYHLPANYLKTCPQEPKQGASNYLGAPHGAAYLDWEYDGDFIVTGYSLPILFRFVAAVSNVQRMDEMFCEAMAASMALETSMTLTQDAGKMQLAGGKYKSAIDRAKLMNGIEQGPTEPPEDDFVSCRM